ncbi:MAG TPA: serine hydrolase domain-containing protein [Gemmatimonas sp.]|uniref:serine hydrolase domain-containing protein n=1 Tax=Gemmatimonas sp. TaxID=1962908 RepID=UPI002ED88A1B
MSLRRVFCHCSCILRLGIAGFLLGSPSGGLAQSAAAVTFGASTEQQVARALVEAINSGDTTRIRRWADSTYLPSIYPRYRDDIFALYRTVQRASGGLIVEQVTGEAWVLVNARLRSTGRLARLGLGFEPGPNQRPVISGWHAYPLADAAADGTWPTTALPLSAVRDTIRDHLRRSVEHDEFSGVVRVMHGDSVLFEEAHGLAHRGFRIPNTATTRFHIGSQGKMFTAVAIAQLVQARRLRFLDTLGIVLPEYPDSAIARRITIQNLLTHTSGLGFGPSAPATRPSDWRTQRAMTLVPAFAGQTLSFEPGTRWQYSNAGFTLLAAVVEKVSGMPFDEYVRTNIWEPAGMTHTDWGVVDDPADDRAVGYGWFNDDPIGAQPRRPFWASRGQRGGGAGGQFSTVQDLTRFAAALRSGKLLSPAVWAHISSTRGAPADNYGYGFFTYAFNGPAGVRRPSAGHGGGGASSGIDGGVFWFSDGSWTVAVLGNYDAPAAQNIIFRIMRFLAHQP